VNSRKWHYCLLKRHSRHTRASITPSLSHSPLVHVVVRVVVSIMYALPPPTRYNALEIATFVLGLGSWIHWLLNIGSIDPGASIPMQYGLHGEVVWSVVGRWWSSIYCVCLTLLVAAVFFAHDRPDRYNYPFKITHRNRMRQYALAHGMFSLVMLQAAVLLAFVQWNSVLVIDGSLQALPSWPLQLSLVGMAITLASYLLLAYLNR
jgi:hypothetical protein